MSSAGWTQTLMPDQVRVTDRANRVRASVANGAALVEGWKTTCAKNELELVDSIEDLRETQGWRAGREAARLRLGLL